MDLYYVYPVQEVYKDKLQSKKQEPNKSKKKKNTGFQNVLDCEMLKLKLNK